MTDECFKLLLRLLPGTAAALDLLGIVTLEQANKLCGIITQRSPASWPAYDAYDLTCAACLHKSPKYHKDQGMPFATRDLCSRMDVRDRVVRPRMRSLMSRKRKASSAGLGPSTSEPSDAVLPSAPPFSIEWLQNLKLHNESDVTADGSCVVCGLKVGTKHRSKLTTQHVCPGMPVFIQDSGAYVNLPGDTSLFDGF